MSVEFKDYYTTLGVRRDASQNEIKAAFRKLARKYHPDVAKDKKSAEAKFKEINEANEVLGDPVKREKYDRLGANWDQERAFPPPGGRGRRQAAGGQEFNFGGTGFSDFFEQFFSGNSGGSGPGFPDVRHHGTRKQKGGDIEGDILVTLDEAMQGAVRPVSLQISNPKTGQAETRTFQVRIPPGVTNGRRIRVPGQGQPGSGGAEAGDLFLRVRHAAHPDFHTEAADLFYNLEIAPWDAVLGADISVPTLDGSVKLRIAPGSEHGHQLRVRNRGLPKGKSDERGDFYAVIEIKLPTHLSDDERGLWEKLRAVSHYNPRTEKS